MGPVVQINLTAATLREMKRAGGGKILVELTNHRTGEVTRTETVIPIEAIDRLLQMHEACERAARN